jgi:hypothetical protein
MRKLISAQCAVMVFLCLAGCRESRPIVGTWFVKTPEAPFPYHMLVFHSDGTVGAERVGDARVPYRLIPASPASRDGQWAASARRPADRDIRASASRPRNPKHSCRCHSSPATRASRVRRDHRQSTDQRGWAWLRLPWQSPACSSCSR